MLSHFSGIIALAVWTLVVTLFAPCQLIVIKFYAQSGPIGDFHAPVHDRHPASENHFIFLGLPRVMRIAGIAQVRGSGRHVSHPHQGNPEVIVRMHGQAQAKSLA